MLMTSHPLTEMAGIDDSSIFLPITIVFRREKNTKSFVNYILLFTLYLYVMYVA